MSLSNLQKAMAAQLNRFPIRNTGSQQKQQHEHGLTYAITPVDHLTIYQNNTLATRINAIADIYHHIRLCLGESYARQLMKQYVSITPSTNEDLNCYGRSFIEYVAQQQQYRKELAGFPYLSDLARAEWFLHDSYYHRQPPVQSKDPATQSTFDFQSFAQIAPEEIDQVVLHLAQGIYLLQSEYPLHAIMALNLDTETESLKADQDHYYFVLDNAYGENLLQESSQTDFQLLQAIIEQRPFAELGQIASRLSVDLGEKLTHWIDKSYIDKFSIKETANPK